MQKSSFDRVSNVDVTNVRLAFYFLNKNETLF